MTVIILVLGKDVSQNTDYMEMVTNDKLQQTFLEYL